MELYLQGKKCQWVKSLTVRSGTFSIQQERMVFQYETAEQKASHIAIKPHVIPNDRRFIKEWPLEMVREIYKRRYIQRKTAIEILFTDGSTVLLNFPEGQDVDEVSQRLIKLRKIISKNMRYYKTLEPKKLIEKSGMLKKWLNHQISNLTYLMYLNSLGGRSYKDLTQYPVFPWVLKNFSSEQIDLQHPDVYRDLSKNMGQLGSEDRIQQFKERFDIVDPFNPVINFL